MSEDCYAILHVSDDASDAAIRRAYLELIRRHHPDAAQDPQANAAAAAINRAYETLTDPARRARHDRRLASARASMRQDSTSCPDLAAGATPAAHDFETRFGGAKVSSATAPSPAFREGELPPRRIRVTVPAMGPSPHIVTVRFERLERCAACSDARNDIDIARAARDRCTRCNGTRRELAIAQMRLRVPDKVREGAVLVVPDAGDASAVGRTRGALHVVLRVTDRPPAPQQSRMPTGD